MNDILFYPLGDPVNSGPGLNDNTDIDPRLTRSHYFDGRLLTAEDLTRDQLYLDQRLRELGRVLGRGVMDGLELSFDRFSGQLTLQPGQALTLAGRVLELGNELQVDLGERGLISGLNKGKYRRFNRALYAVVLRYLDVNTEIAEMFPKDLGAERGFQHAMVTESVQLGLVALPVPLPQQSSLQIRSRLMCEFLGNEQFSSLIPEDAVALGVLAVKEDTPQWLDAELLRHPVRAEAVQGDLQADLSRQYEILLQDILTHRLSGGLTGDFHAADYFSLLPPVGTLPKDAIDPTSGRQGYFPENYHVAIAPIRQSDVALIKAESLNLPPIDLLSGEGLNLEILVPLNNLDYGHYAAQLERGIDADTRNFPQIDLLKLKLYPRQPVHALDTDQSAWAAIWDRLGDNQPFYVRRPTRAAETAISGIVLAQGFDPPTPDGTPDFNPADSGGLIQDENSIFLARLNLQNLAELRPPPDSESNQTYLTLQENFGHSALVTQQCSQILLYVERNYDQLTWPTLLALADNHLLTDFLNGLREAETETSTPMVVAELLGTLELNNSLREQWSELIS